MTIRDTVLRALALCVVLTMLNAARGAESVDRPELVVTEDTTLDPARTYGRIVIRAPNVTIDGKGAWVVGSIQGDAKNFKHDAISAKDVSGVTLRNINAKGWESGLHVVRGSNWVVENCNFSDNFHDPKFGWGEQGRRGGIVLENVSKSTLRKNKANNVWDACVLVDSDENTLSDNDFSHTSDTCLKLWHSSSNNFNNNNLSYGIRKDPGEVHARDSTCVLIESGSNDNKFTHNDCTHGGDGIFIRVLNGWISTGNHFESNDCSYANNNAIEAWSPRNTWVRNKANHSSYGFWLGASDQNSLVENEASFNGSPKGNHNSPHLPKDGHAGIVFMFGPSSHTTLIGNTCEGNNGAGIAAIGDIDSKGKNWKAFHWVVQQNKLIDNRWGIYLAHCEMFDLAANTFRGNSVAEVFEAENVIGLTKHTGEQSIAQAPEVKLSGPEIVEVGESVMFDASASRDPRDRALNYRWQLGSEAAGAASTLRHTFPAPGFYRLALTVNNGLLSNLAWRDIYAVAKTNEFGTEGNAANWTWIDPLSKVAFVNDEKIHLVGRSSLRADISPYSGGRVTLSFNLPEPAALANPTRLVFWVKTRNENVPAWQDVNPLVTLVGAKDEQTVLSPTRDFLSNPPYIEAREGWTYFEVPLAGDADWKRSGESVETLKSLRFGFDSWGAPPLKIWIDGLELK